ncbi:MAG TPA: neutral/alkaline non-lysosomal ceramidase N-terminal domain-containing protein [Verrucomicrobiae bacterium]|nr:neutral/alkaline non-lysosomal ceramidase N-terminal domain-containing protein [Verrucomicrobiae bacterium]
MSLVRFVFASLHLGWLLLTAFLLSTGTLAAEELWKVGVARANITPSEPLWLAGYSGRTRPADGKIMDLWIKVLALEDAQGHRGIILTSDTLGIPQGIYRNIANALKEKFDLKPDQFILSASHTHCGPVLRDALYDMYPLDDQQRAVIEKYSADLEVKIVETIGKAVADLAPARLAAGQGTTGFAVNRRNNPEGNVSKLIAQGDLKGPVDHAVPVLAAFLPDGKLKAILFGYACHNPVMDFYNWSGDYAGFAQIALEKSHPDATALFFIGCGADQNPLPRRRLELAERYGNMLAAAAEEVLLVPPRTLPPQLKTSIEMLTLNLGDAPTEAELEKLATDKNATTRRWAARLLKQLKSGKPFIRTYPYPVQAWRLGGTQLLITLGGETVVDYALKLKAQFGAQTWVAGYCNDVMSYIPSLRVLKEGGYEGGGAMIVYGLPAVRWAEDVEDLITGSVRRLVMEINRN